MQSKLTKIQLYLKGEAPNCVEISDTIKNYGLSGDRHCMKDKKQIPITGENILSWIEAQSIRELCFRKFSANLILDNMNGDKFHIGDLIEIGEYVVCITGIHKMCFYDECEFFRNCSECRA